MLKISSEYNLSIKLIQLDFLKNIDNTMNTMFNKLNTNEKINIILNSNCKMGIELLEKCFGFKCFSPWFHWLIYENNSQRNAALKVMQNLSISVDADISYVNFGKYIDNVIDR